MNKEMEGKANERKAIREKRKEVAHHAAELETQTTHEILEQSREIKKDLEERRKMDDLLTRILVRSFGNAAEQQEFGSLVSRLSPPPS